MKEQLAAAIKRLSKHMILKEEYVVALVLGCSEDPDLKRELTANGFESDDITYLEQTEIVKGGKVLKQSYLLTAEAHLKEAIARATGTALHPEPETDGREINTPLIEARIEQKSNPNVVTIGKKDIPLEPMENDTTAASVEPTVSAQPTNELIIQINDSGLEKASAERIKEIFLPFWEATERWSDKAKALVVTSSDQLTEMKMAGEARKALKSIRVAVEKRRKELKEDSLRTGRAIDSIAKVLKERIEPIETYLDEQEKFAEREEAARKDAVEKDRTEALSKYPGLDLAFYDLRNMPEENFQQLLRSAQMAEEDRIAKEKAEAEAAAKAEAERIAKEKAEAEERARIAEENQRLKAEAEAKQRELEAERKSAEEALAAERAAAEAEKKRLAEEARAKQEAERKAREEAEAKVRAEAEQREKIEKQLAEAKAAEAKRLAEEEAQRKALAEAEEEARRKAATAPDKEKLSALARQIESVPMPEVSEAAAKIIEGTKTLLGKVSKYINDEAAKL